MFEKSPLALSNFYMSKGKAEKVLVNLILCLVMGTKKEVSIMKYAC